jgi:hypothetical protein
MRRPGADLEEKPEPRVALLAEAQNGDGMKQSGRGLTRAAIEKPTFDNDARRFSPSLVRKMGLPLRRSAAQLQQQPFRRDEVRRVEPLGETVIHWTQCLDRFGGAAPIA